MNTGIVRKIDDLGRIVLPKELRKTLNLNSGDDLKILIDNEKIILEKYSRLDNYQEFIKSLINCFEIEGNFKLYFVIKDRIINNNMELVTNVISNIILSRRKYINEKDELNIITDSIKEKGKIIIYPIVLESDLLGTIIIIGNENIFILERIVNVINNIVKETLK